MGTTDLTLEERLMGRESKEEPCTECRHNVEHHTFEGVGRHDHAACAFCCQASKFVRIKSNEAKNQRCLV